MKDRISAAGKKGYVKLTPKEDAGENIYQMERADEPVQEGTPLSKSTLFDSENELIYALSGDKATPNEALKKIGKHIKRTKIEILTGEIEKNNYNYSVPTKTKTGTWTVPDGVTELEVIMIGAGGDQSAGHIIKETLDVSDKKFFYFSVGAGDSTFGELVAKCSTGIDYFAPEFTGLSTYWCGCSVGGKVDSNYRPTLFGGGYCGGVFGGASGGQGAAWAGDTSNHTARWAGHGRNAYFYNGNSDLSKVPSYGGGGGGGGGQGGLTCYFRNVQSSTTWYGYKDGGYGGNGGKSGNKGGYGGMGGSGGGAGYGYASGTNATQTSNSYSKNASGTGLTGTDGTSGNYNITDPTSSTSGTATPSSQQGKRGAGKTSASTSRFSQSGGGGGGGNGVPAGTTITFRDFTYKVTAQAKGGDGGDAGDLVIKDSSWNFASDTSTSNNIYKTIPNGGGGGGGGGGAGIGGYINGVLKGNGGKGGKGGTNQLVSPSSSISSTYIYFGGAGGAGGGGGFMADGGNGGNGADYVCGTTGSSSSGIYNGSDHGGNGGGGGCLGGDGGDGGGWVVYEYASTQKYYTPTTGTGGKGYGAGIAYPYLYAGNTNLQSTSLTAKQNKLGCTYLYYPKGGIPNGGAGGIGTIAFTNQRQLPCCQVNSSSLEYYTVVNPAPGAIILRYNQYFEEDETFEDYLTNL